MNDNCLKKSTSSIKKSLIIPIYKNEENIPTLLIALQSIAEEQGALFEVLFVIDGSPDNSFNLLQQASPTLGFSVKIINHSRNFGAFAAIRTGIEYAEGEFIAVISADLQEPLELINDFFSILEKDSADVVFGQRLERRDPPVKKILSTLYWFFYRKLVMPAVPSGGVDVFALNQRVKNAILSIKEHNSSIIAQLFWVGYRRAFIPYKRKERTHGVSAWGLNKRLNYMLDSIFSYSDIPVKCLLYAGVAGILFTIFFGSFTFIGKLFGFINIPGYTTILLVLLFFGSLILISQGIIGCYIWRTLENSKQRPLTIVSNIEDNIKRTV